MSIQPISDKLFEYLLSNVSGEHFESIAQVVFGAHYGEDYTPLGGMHDGGADGFILPHIYEGQKPNTFFQFSVTDEKRAKQKITDTIAALRKAGREPKQLIYSTTEKLPKQDTLVSDIFEQHQILLTIRDSERLKLLVNSNNKANKSFLTHFKPEIEALKDSAKSLRGSVNEFVGDPTIFAFLDHELRNRFKKDHLNDRIVDSIIYWTLRNTDPDEDRFLTREEITESIKNVLPTATSVLLPQVNNRLKELSKRDVGGSERIRHHTKDDKFCLPFEMRKRLTEQSIDELELQSSFLESIGKRLTDIQTVGYDTDTIDLGIKLIFESVHEYFVEQGLILSAYLENKVDSVHISDQIVEDQVSRVLDKSDTKAKIPPSLVHDALKVLRGVFYNPCEIEKLYLQYLSRISLLFMTLQTAPKLVEYFNKMGGNFNLLVGTDMLIKAISEQHLPEGYRQVEILLNACNELGATMIITEPVLKEVFTHLHAVDLEYRNHYQQHDNFMTTESIAECDRILIRAYYYKKRESKTPFSWDTYLNTFLEPVSLRKKAEKGIDELKGFLTLKYKMKFLSTDEIKHGVNMDGVNALAEKLIQARGEKNEELSFNDALMVYATYAQRNQHHESGIYDGFGFRTWWLTKETQVLNFTSELVQKEGGVPFIMRPEFLLNFITLAPNASKVRQTFREFLPTTVGLQLGQHLKQETMHQLLAGTEEWDSLPPERVAVLINEKVNRLKFDRYKQYTTSVQ